jgi:membrane-associated phospholipid phosphatase
MIIPFPRRKKETFFLHHWRPAILVVLALVIWGFFHLDLLLAQYFEHISPLVYTLAGRWTDLIAPKFHTLFWPTLFFMARFLLNQKKWADIALLFTVCIAASNLTVEMLKWFFGRTRPELFFSEHLYSFTFFSSSPLFQSFPSGHACTAGALVAIFASLLPKRSLLFILMGCALAFTRVILNEHYFSDVVSGFAIGVILSQWICIKMKTNP